ncbi:MAG: valine--tRNA ligase [bacterium]
MPCPYGECNIPHSFCLSEVPEVEGHGKMPLDSEDSARGRKKTFPITLSNLFTLPHSFPKIPPLPLYLICSPIGNCMLDKGYTPSTLEDSIYHLWESNNLFAPATADAMEGESETYCLIMPPPNVTGKLHMGHAMYVVQDILVRYHRMAGFRTLYLPGTDHAGIATQNVVEKQLAKDGVSRHDLGREQFLKKVWEWKEESGTTITKQLRKLGMSCDWTRERFTLDDHSSAAVREAFVKLYEKDLIYRGYYIVNWCPRCQSVIADDEVEHKTMQSFLWHIRYPMADERGKIVVATTRPETMLGDTGVAVHDGDIRYKQFIGHNVRLPLSNRLIPVVGDHAVDPKFGTGAVKVTPSHDFNDYEMAKRHELPHLQVLDLQNTMTKEAGAFAGMSVEEARVAVEEALREGGFLEKKEPYEHSVGVCYRCHTTIQPQVSRQWFVRSQPLAQAAIAMVKSGKIKIIPKRFNKIYFQWLDNIRDWCISRQLWWGHRIPVYYNDAGEVRASTTPPAESGWHQDEDVLDTWFSSALWPFSTLGWPEGDNADLDEFFPTSVLVTAYDILFFWVERMAMLGVECTGEIPFHHVLLTGLVRDEQGRKMSKSLGNALDPLEIIKEYGADALRYSLVAAVSPGNDLNYSIPKTQGYRYFANKVWNAARFVMMKCPDIAKVSHTPPSPMTKLSMAQRWIVSRLHQVVGSTTKNIQRYELSEAALGLYDFFWHEFCDWYLEIAKINLSDDADPAAKKLEETILSYVLCTSLKLLHPFLPFLTEAIWQELGHEEKYLITASWPKTGKVSKTSLDDFARIKRLVTEIRTLRSTFGVKPSAKLDVFIIGEPFLSEDELSYLQNLASLGGIVQQENALHSIPNSLKTVVDSYEILLQMGDDFDKTAETARIQKEIGELTAYHDRLAKELSNKQFVSKAPKQVVEGKQKTLVETSEKVRKLQQQAKMLA